MQIHITINLKITSVKLKHHQTRVMIRKRNKNTLLESAYESPIQIPRLIRSPDNVNMKVLALINYAVHFLQELVANTNFPANLILMLPHQRIQLIHKHNSRLTLSRRLPGCTEKLSNILLSFTQPLRHNRRSIYRL